MRISIICAAAAAMVLAGCSSSSSSSSGSTGSTTTTATTGGSTGSSGSSGTTGTGASTSTSGSSGTNSSSGSGSGGTTSSNCQASGSSGSTGGDFSCLGQVPPPQQAGADINVNANLGDQHGSPIVGATIKVCTDAACGTPLDTQVTDANGDVVLTIPQANTPFTGYFDVSAVTDPQSSQNSSLPMLIYAPPLSASLDVNFIGVRNSDVAGIQLTTGISVQSTDGQIIGNTSDCAGTSAPQTVVSSSLTDGSNTKVVYFAFNSGLNQEVPTPSATSTDATGNWIIANVPPGNATVTAKEYFGCTQIAQRQVITRAGTITNVLVTPQ